MKKDYVEKWKAVGFIQREEYPHEFTHPAMPGEEFDFSAASVEGAIIILANHAFRKGIETAQSDIRKALGIRD